MRYRSPKSILIQRLALSTVLLAGGVGTLLWCDLGWARMSGMGYILAAVLIVWTAYCSWRLDPYG